MAGKPLSDAKHGILGNIGAPAPATGLIPITDRHLLPDAGPGKFNPVQGEVPRRGSPPAYADGRFSNTGAEKYRRHPDGRGKVHGGIDIVAPVGTPVRAAAGGIAGFGTLKDYGNVVYVQHPDGMFSVYGHLRGQDVAQFQPVQAGQVIGYSGVSGNADKKAPHLHYETWNGGLKILPQGLAMPGVAERARYRVNPEAWLQAPLKQDPGGME